MPSNPLALVLAAGFSRRFGADKRLARLGDGRTVLESVVQAIEAAGLDCVVAQNSDRQLPLAVSLKRLTIPAAIAARGMGASLAAAVQQLPSDTDLIVCLADMPFVLPSTYAALAAAMRPGRIVCPRYHGKRGNPVGFSNSFREALIQLEGDRGARDLLQKWIESVDFIEVDDPGIHRDIDLPQDLD